MTPEQFAYWPQGFVELTRGEAPDDAQWKSIREHLETVFKKVTPAIGEQPEPTKQTPSEHRKTIDEMWRKLREYEQERQYPNPFKPWYTPGVVPQSPHWLAPSEFVPDTIIC